MVRITNYKRTLGIGRRKVQYLFQKTTGFGISRTFERDLKRKADEYLATGLQCKKPVRNIATVRLSDLELRNDNRYSVFREERYTRFVANDTRSETDYFGRKGTWVSRGCRIYYDRLTNDYVKVFDEYFCRRGEGRFLGEALDRGFYDFLCPNLSYVIRDDDNEIRGYAIREGRQLTRYEFERYVSGCLRELICAVTRRTGLYFRDLAWHNVIIDKGELSLIDVDSVLPVDWFGRDDEFSLYHLSEIDVGWPIHRIWRPSLNPWSPTWYWEFLKDLTGRENSPITAASPALQVG